MKKLFLFLLVTLNLISCTASKCSHLKPPSQERHNKSILPVKSFVKIDTVVKTSGAEDEPQKFSSASGFFVSENQIITAGHFCNLDNVFMFFITKDIPLEAVAFFIQTFDGSVRQGSVVKIDKEADLCLMQINGNTSKIDKVVLEFSDVPPIIGEKVINIAAPLGIFTKEMVPIFEGYYCGTSLSDDGEQVVDLYSLPIVSGSSGSPIINRRGKVIGVVIAGVTKFQHLGFSPSYDVVRKFLRP